MYHSGGCVCVCVCVSVCLSVCLSSLVCVVGYFYVRWCNILVLWVFFFLLNWMFQHDCLDTYCFWVSYLHAFSIFVFAPVQHNWACFTWKSALEIRSLLFYYYYLHMHIQILNLWSFFMLQKKIQESTFSRSVCVLPRVHSTKRCWACLPTESWLYVFHLSQVPSSLPCLCLHIYTLPALQKSLRLEINLLIRFAPSSNWCQMNRNTFLTVCQHLTWEVAN